MVPARESAEDGSKREALRRLHAWVEGMNHRRATVDEDFMNALTWLEGQPAALVATILATHDHPGVAFAAVIELLIARSPTDAGARATLVDWLCANRKCPFGMILKTKALRVLARGAGALTPRQVADLRRLQVVSDALPYRPREILHLDRLLARIGTLSPDARG